MKSTNPIVNTAIKRFATNAKGNIDYSQFKPESKWDVLDDLDTIANYPGAIDDMKRIKPYAKKFGVMGEFNKVCRELNFKL